MTFPTEWKNKRCSKPPTSIENDPVEIVSFPMNNMVDLSSSLCQDVDQRVPVDVFPPISPFQHKYLGDSCTKCQSIVEITFFHLFTPFSHVPLNAPKKIQGARSGTPLRRAAQRKGLQSNAACAPWACRASRATNAHESGEKLRISLRGVLRCP